MSYLARLLCRNSPRRPAPARYHVESLEERNMLSATAASLAATQANVSSVTVLTTSLNTVVTGAKVFLSASVENSSTDAPITSGKVDFVVVSPSRIDLGTVNVSKQGQATIPTHELTRIANYEVVAKYTPTNPHIAASAAAPVTVKVIPLPIDVPTSLTLSAPVTKTETGQGVPLLATVKDAGTGDQIDAGDVQTIKGKVEFYTNSADPIVLGTIPVNKKDFSSILTKKITAVGPYQVEAKFLPSNKDFTASSAAPLSLAITPTTLNAPTSTTVQAPVSIVETGEPITLNATVENSDSSLPDGVVEFATLGPHHVVLNTVPVTTFGEPVSYTTSFLQKVGIYHIQAKYLPNTNRFAESFSVPITVAITPLTAASFRVKPLVSHGQLNKPASFEVTAVNVHGQPVTNYTGTVVLTSPTDSWTTFPASVYASLHISAPPPQSTGLAQFAPQSYTFTAADQGSHTFFGAVTFGKAGAETVKVTQANDPKVIGRATFAIE
jgi:hypothetical protein